MLSLISGHQQKNKDSFGSHQQGMIKAGLRALRMSFLTRGAAFSIVSFALPGQEGMAYLCCYSITL
jgi:hypothetical protein